MTDSNLPPQDPGSQGAPGPAAPLPHEQDVQWASFAHLGGILGFLPSLIIWLVFKDRGAFTNTEAKEALNFQITAVFAYVAIFIVNAILTAVTFGIWGFIGWILPLALWVAVIVFSVLGFMQAKDGNHYRYPFAIRLIK
ncbi:membrane protein [Agromyces marinus]|uniref:Membrane protein n=1 Tax=Agromyces marinus TaxID=1389020 RepID=A0ABM8GXU8_9MICO|nr:membrane protein [Agromyces marinus]